MTTTDAATNEMFDPEYPVNDPAPGSHWYSVPLTLYVQATTATDAERQVTQVCHDFAAGRHETAHYWQLHTLGAATTSE